VGLTLFCPPVASEPAQGEGGERREEGEGQYNNIIRRLLPRAPTEAGGDGGRGESQFAPPASDISGLLQVFQFGPLLRVVVVLVDVVVVVVALLLLLLGHESHFTLHPSIRHSRLIASATTTPSPPPASQPPKTRTTSAAGWPCWLAGWLNAKNKLFAA